jgi:GWxTD domain-containing protein
MWCAWPAVAAAQIPVVLDYAGFRLEPGTDSCYMEFYYGIDRDKLTFDYLDEDSMWQARIVVTLTVRDTLDAEVKSGSKLVLTHVETRADARRRDVRIFDVLSLYLRPGVYGAHLRVQDQLSGDVGENHIARFAVRDLGTTDALALSDLEFAYGIRWVGDSATAAPAKVKNRYYIEPNPSNFYAPEDSLLYFYGEVYNIEPDPGAYTVHVLILDRFGGLVKDLGPQIVARPGESALLTYGVRIQDLEPNARYTVAVEVDHGDQSASVRDSFWLGGSVMLPVASAQESFTEEDAALYLRLLQYIATAVELQEYQALGLQGKSLFLERFWETRDPDPQTPENEYREEHVRRFNLANEWYSRSMVQRDDGWNTDRGRVLIMYGVPDEIVENASSVGSWPWERWEYRQLEGGVFFIFLDWKNLGDYRLMHSNKQGERYDPDWQQKIDYEGLDIINR